LQLPVVLFACDGKQTGGAERTAGHCLEIGDCP
jgi:hypothetical protein